MEVRNSIKEKLTKLNLPFVEKQLANQKDKMFDNVLAKNIKLLEKCDPNYLKRAKRLACDFWSSNKNANLSSFKAKIVTLLLACRDHVCGHKDPIAIRQDLSEACATTYR